MIRKAETGDLDAIERIYQEIHDAETAGVLTTGWIKGIYPTRATAEAALARDDLFVIEEDGCILGSGIINQLQVDAYEGAPWKWQVPVDQVCVLHTLVISPSARGKGYGRAFIWFYEDYALQHGCTESCRQSHVQQIWLSGDRCCSDNFQRNSRRQSCSVGKADTRRLIVQIARETRLRNRARPSSSVPFPLPLLQGNVRSGESAPV